MTVNNKNKKCTTKELTKVSDNNKKYKNEVGILERNSKFRKEN